MIAGNTNGENLLLAVTTTADLAGLRAAERGVAGLGGTVSGMSATSKAALEGLDADARKAALAFMGLKEDEDKAVASTNKLTEATEKSAVAMAAARRAAQAGITSPIISSGGQLGQTYTEQSAAATTANKNQAASAKVVNEEYKKMPNQYRTAANSLSMLSNAAVTGTGSLGGMANAAGALAMSIAMVSNSAKLAATASGIGALITVATLVIGAFAKMKDEAKLTQQEIDSLNTYTLSTIDDVISAMDKKNAKMEEQAATEEGFLSRMLHRRAIDPATGKPVGMLTDIMDSLGLSSPAMRALEHGLNQQEQLQKNQAKMASDETKRVQTQLRGLDVQSKLNDIEMSYTPGGGGLHR
jgi:hypothetical protein